MASHEHGQEIGAPEGRGDARGRPPSPADERVMGLLDWIRRRRERAAQMPAEGALWIEASDNPFGVRVLDLRPVTQGMISTSGDPQNAARAISWGTATVEVLAPFAPGEEGARVACELEYPIAGSFPDGLLYAPPAMEQKWALFHQAASILAVRSWSGQVAAVARGVRHGDRLVLRELETVKLGLGPLGDPVATFDWLVRTHALKQELPLPCSEAGLDMLAKAPLMVFSGFGDMARLATAGCVIPPAPGQRLRVSSAVFQAAREDDAPRVRALLAGGADPDAPSPIDGYVALHVAMARVQADVMRALLDARANPNITTDDGRCALGIGIVNAAPIPLLEELAAAGADLHLVSRDGFGLLHAAAEVDRADAIAWLVGRGLDLAIKTKAGLTPLHIACVLGHAQAARALLSAGADPAMASPKGTPLEMAIRGKHAAVLAVLRPDEGRPA
jgi:Ankyrin repeats (3 copies)